MIVSDMPTKAHAKGQSDRCAGTGYGQNPYLDSMVEVLLRHDDSWRHWYEG